MSVVARETAKGRPRQGNLVVGTEEALARGTG